MKAVLLSGGVDSIALAYWKKPEVAITVDYGQKAALTEISVAQKISCELNMQHEVIRVDCSSLGSGDMAGSQALDAAPVSEWWPYRNQLLITLAGMAALQLGVDELMTGSVSTDASHADGGVNFYDAMHKIMKLQEGSIDVSAPAIGLSTVELIRRSGISKDLLSWAHSCHVGNLACGGCRGCLKHYHVMG